MQKILIISLALFLVSAEAGTKRSYAARAEFVRSNPCPNTSSKKGTCKGWVVDHVEALACGGPDIPGNMQWQTVAEAKAKDKWERKGCSKR